MFDKEFTRFITQVIIPESQDCRYMELIKGKYDEKGFKREPGVKVNWLLGI